MTFGLEVFDQNGDGLMLLTDRLTRWHSTHIVSVTGPSNSVFIPIIGMTNDGSWVCFVEQHMNINMFNIISDGGFNMPINTPQYPTLTSVTIHVIKI